ncbi:hypothetical protein K3888_15540 [Dietzia aurantiaca]|uniref:hypothetical protein n=1 Tax=Dietzia aurantiaca TaxID=983873 RepID=UPI001E5B5E22|nr:hypothetical protein [Dietzia aurantiaca]MCD2264109.1 hypothetical protein [Dietzia aurantiaca]
MAHSKRIATLASAAALAGGTILAGAGAAGAQGSSEVANDLQLASIALNGPVSVSPNAEGGPTVAYTNEGDEAQQCIGFTAPYSTIEENDIDPREIDPNDLTSLGVLGTIQGGGGVSVLTVSPQGEPAAVVSGPGLDLVGTATTFGTGVTSGLRVPAGETVTWDAPAPANESAAAGVICARDGIIGPRLGSLVNYFGIDPQVVADQANDILGSLGSVGAGSVNGSVVGVGAGLTASLAGGDDTEADSGSGAAPAGGGS